MPYRLAALILALAAPVGAAEKLSDFEWQADIPDFGGFSGLWVAPDGDRLLTISDRARYVSAVILRDGAHITGLSVTEHGSLLPQAWTDASFLRDAEGLAVAPDGTIHVSFEGLHRVWTYPDLKSKANGTHRWNAFMDLQPNSGMEALAIGPDDTLYAVTERSGAWTRPFPVMRYRGGEWDRSWTLPRDGKFLAVGADFGPDGWFYLLEREFRWYAGFATRIRRFPVGANGFGPGQTVLETRAGELDNMEGISLRADPGGGIIATLISDDNFRGFQATRIVEYRLSGDH